VSWRVENDGFAIIDNLLTADEGQKLISLLGPVSGAGRRGLLGLPAIADLARSGKLVALVRPYLAEKPKAVRAIYFDKTSDANWSVTWHQDLLIAVREKMELAGFGPWSAKAGIPHVQPPVEFLEGMLTLRLHLDEADENNGALRVLPASHRFGVLSSEAMDQLCAQQKAVMCSVAAGGVLLMRPLLLHSSGRASSNGHRRVLHIEYAGFDLPAGLQWGEQAARHG